MPELTLYRANGACSMAPHCILTELDIPFKSVLMKFGPNGVEAADGSIPHSEYLAINPAGYVPALQTEYGIITEMPAVLAFISSLAPAKRLYGQEGFQHAKVLEWTAWLSGSLHSVGFGMRLRPGRFTDDPEFHDAIRTKGTELITKTFVRIDDRLHGKEFAVGEAETVVDYNLIFFWRWGAEIGLDMGKRFPNYTRLVMRMASKDSVQKVVKIEALKPFSSSL